jgi:hypothetical protein
MSLSQKIRDEKNLSLVFINYNRLGQNHFAYLIIKTSLVESLEKSLKLSNFKPEKFGVVLESGLGEPSEKIVEAMQKVKELLFS